MPVAKQVAVLAARKKLDDRLQRLKLLTQEMKRMDKEHGGEGTLLHDEGAGAAQRKKTLLN